MSTTKKDIEKNPDGADRKFCILLYPDTEDYCCNSVLERIQTFDEFAYCLHDSDIMDDGTPKKEHYHVVLRQKTPCTRQTLANKLGIDVRWINRCDKFAKSVQYLIHYNDKEKYQYHIDEIITNLPVAKYFVADAQKFAWQALYQYIITEKPKKEATIIQYVIDNDLIGFYRASYSVWHNLWREVSVYSKIEEEKVHIAEQERIKAERQASFDEIVRTSQLKAFQN